MSFMFGSKRAGKQKRGDLDSFVDQALTQLREAVARRAEVEEISIRPGEAGPGGLGITTGQVAQRIQDSGYIIEWADTQGQIGIVRVIIPIAMIEGERPVP